jgi:hypothetical protein
MTTITKIDIETNNLNIEYKSVGPSPPPTGNTPNIRGYIGNGEPNCQTILKEFSFVEKGAKYVIPDIYNEIILAFTVNTSTDTSKITFEIDLSNLMTTSYETLPKLINDLKIWKNKNDIYNRPKKILLSLGGANEKWDKFEKVVNKNDTITYIKALQKIIYTKDSSPLGDNLGRTKLIDGFDIDYEASPFNGHLVDMCNFMNTVVKQTTDTYYWSSAPEPVLANNSSIYSYYKSKLMKSLDLTTFQCYNNMPSGYNSGELDELAKYNISNYGSDDINCCSMLYKADGLCGNAYWFNPPGYGEGTWAPMNTTDGYINGYCGGGWQIEYPPKGVNKSCFTCKDSKTESFPETKQYWELMYESLMCSYNCNKGSSYTPITSSKNIDCCTSSDISCLKLGLLLPLSPIAAGSSTNDVSATLRYDYIGFLQTISKYNNLTTIGGWCIEQDIWYDNFLKGTIIGPLDKWSPNYGDNLKGINSGDWSANTSSGQPIVSFTAAVHKVYD